MKEQFSSATFGAVKLRHHDFKGPILGVYYFGRVIKAEKEFTISDAVRVIEILDDKGANLITGFIDPLTHGKRIFIEKGNVASSCWLEVPSKYFVLYSEQLKIEPMAEFRVDKQLSKQVETDKPEQPKKEETDGKSKEETK